MYVDEINLLDDSVSNCTFVLAEGVNVVEREGITLRHPCRPLLIATFNPEEGQLRSTCWTELRVTLACSHFPRDSKMAEATDGIKSTIILAREWLKEAQSVENRLNI